MLDFVYLPSLSFAPWLLKKGDRMMLIKSSLTAFYHLPRHLQRQQVLDTYTNCLSIVRPENSLDRADPCTAVHPSALIV